MVNVNNLSIKFNDTKILEDISFDVKAGEIVSGSKPWSNKREKGKSSLSSPLQKRGREWP